MIIIILLWCCSCWLIKMRLAILPTSWRWHGSPGSLPEWTPHHRLTTVMATQHQIHSQRSLFFTALHTCLHWHLLLKAWQSFTVNCVYINPLCYSNPVGATVHFYLYFKYQSLVLNVIYVWIIKNGTNFHLIQVVGSGSETPLLAD